MLLIGSYDDESGAGIECLALDRGPGMADVAASLRDGHSTAGSPGNGLGAVLRGAHLTDIYSLPGQGTAILARFEPGRPDRLRPSGPSTVRTAYGAVSVPMPGEEACGDGWCHAAADSAVALMVADGLGHGPLAAEASHAAAQMFIRMAERSPSEMLAAMHGALKSTRGAAVAIARIDRSAGEVVFAGVGNVAATIVDADHGLRRMVSNNGTIGHIARHMRGFTYPIGAGQLIILASDGLGTNWRLDAYPGLTACHPTVIAGVLYRDFRRGRDDVTVLVYRLHD